MRKTILIALLLSVTNSFMMAQYQHEEINNENDLKNEKCMEHLDKKQQAMVAISASTATGNQEALKPALIAGLDAGLTVNEITEALVQLYAYTGFPRSLTAIGMFMRVIDERKAEGIHDVQGKEASPITDTRDKYERGKENLQTLTQRVEGTPTGANAFAPAIDVFLKEHLFADIFERDVLTFQQRELVTVSALTAMTGVDPMLQSHRNMALNTGLTQAQLDEITRIVRE